MIFLCILCQHFEDIFYLGTIMMFYLFLSTPNIGSVYSEVVKFLASKSKENEYLTLQRAREGNAARESRSAPHVKLAPRKVKSLILHSPTNKRDDFSFKIILMIK